MCVNVQVYQQSQSNKKSIYKIIKAGCKSLQFYGNSYRMVPKDVQPKVCHLQMHVAEETTPKKVTKSSTSCAKGKQSRLSFGLYKGHIPGTLKDDELLIWKERYALSDREERDVSQAVAACIKPQKLPCLQKHCDITDEDEGATSDLLECSSTTGRLQLSLDRWIEWQRAPVSTQHIGHSTTTRQLVNVLQFTENVTEGQDFVSSYDMEMKMFLHHGDIIPSSSNQRSEEPAISSTAATAEGRRSDKRGKRRLCFDSEDEDFLISSSSKKKGLSQKARSCSVDVSPSSNMVDSTSAGNNDTPVAADISLIPPPPNINSLSWMDHLPASQSPNRTIISTPLPLNYSTPVKTPSKGTAKVVPPSKNKALPLNLPHVGTPIGTSSKPVSVGNNKTMSSKPVPPKQTKASTPKLVGTLKTLSLPVSQKNDEVAVTPKQSTPVSPKHVSLVGTPYLERHSDGNQATKPGHSPVKLKQKAMEFASKPKAQSPAKSSPSVSKRKLASNANISLVAKPNLKTPTKVSAIKPTTAMGLHTFASRSPATGSPMSVPIIGKSTDDIDTIPESDMESEETPIATVVSDSRVKNDELEDDSFAVLHNKKKKNYQPSFLCTQLPSTPSLHKAKRKEIDSSTDDDFTPVKKRNKFTANGPSSSSTQEEEFLELEAKESSCDETLTEDNVDEQGVNAYDSNDSFINDATQLTQLPSKSPVNNMEAFYKQSLISPNNGIFAGKQTGNGAKYRMQISRGHKLLHHFMGKAGIRVMPTDQSQSGIGNESFTGSEAEEDYLALSQDVSDCDISDFTPKKPSNRRAVIITPGSVASPTLPQHQAVSDVPPKKLLFTPQANAPVAPVTKGSSSCSSDVIVSPSLLVSSFQ